MSSDEQQKDKLMAHRKQQLANLMELIESVQ